jgi:ApbE superfamily uncharacterized protein (UPF0280 family)
VVSLLSARWSRGETRILVKAENEESLRAAISAARAARLDVERYVLRHPEFRYSLEPVRVRERQIPRVISLMLEAAEAAGVGPFAAVAGAIAQVASEAAGETGGAVVENGGDISATGSLEFSVGIFAGDSPLSGRIGLRVSASDLPAGICTSSGTVGHSLSFGSADAAVVVADGASLADAAATAVANEVRGEDEEQSVKLGLESAERIDGIRGCLVIRGRHAGMVGRLPRLIQVERSNVLSEVDWV